MKLAREFPVKLMCEILAYPRSSYYHQARERDDQVLEVVSGWPTYEPRRGTA